MTEPSGTVFRRIVLVVALLNLSYFGIEFTVAHLIGSVSLFADSVDFLEDTSINLLIFVAVGWTARRRSVVGSVLALVILVPSVATIWTAVIKILDPVAPDVTPLALTALGALAINLTCAVLLVRHRHHAGSLATAAWLSARNDALANLAIILVAFLTAWWHTGWLDILLGVAIGLLTADAARAVWKASRAERALLQPEP
ncbi:MAG: cation transporter [Terrimesophilobacter sp.]